MPISTNPQRTTYPGSLLIDKLLKTCQFALKKQPVCHTDWLNIRLKSRPKIMEGNFKN